MLRKTKVEFAHILERTRSPNGHCETWGAHSNYLWTFGKADRRLEVAGTSVSGMSYGSRILEQA